MFACAQHHSKVCIKYGLMGEGRGDILCKLMGKDSGNITLEWNHRMRKQGMQIQGPLGGVEVCYGEDSGARSNPTSTERSRRR